LPPDRRRPREPGRLVLGLGLLLGATAVGFGTSLGDLALMGALAVEKQFTVFGGLATLDALLRRGEQVRMVSTENVCLDGRPAGRPQCP
jgi:hypothetical protein